MDGIGLWLRPGATNPGQDKAERHRGKQPSNGPHQKFVSIIHFMIYDGNILTSPGSTQDQSIGIALKKAGQTIDGIGGVTQSLEG